eukprot:1164825-Ditylum_brightwellii.AAC.1
MALTTDQIAAIDAAAINAAGLTTSEQVVKKKIQTMFEFDLKRVQWDQDNSADEHIEEDDNSNEFEKDSQDKSETV